MTGSGGGRGDLPPPLNSSPTSIQSEVAALRMFNEAKAAFLKETGYAEPWLDAVLLQLRHDMAEERHYPVAVSMVNGAWQSRRPSVRLTDPEYIARAMVLMARYAQADRDPQETTHDK